MRAGTIIASNYLEMAKLLAGSFLEQHPDDTFAILLVDDRPVDEPGDDRIDILRLSDLDLASDEVDLMRSIYDVMELATAVKPALLQTLLRDDDLACYIDPDIYVYGSFTDVIEPARTVGIVLTPHALEPIPRDGHHPTERVIMQSGIMNLGFIAVGRPAGEFLAWWRERLLVDAISAIELNLFTDQRWIDWVPALFDHVVSRDPGMNIAWWNIHERRMERGDDGAILVNGHPLRFVHFSGYSPSTPEILSKHQAEPPRTEHADGSVIRELADEYGRRLIESGHADRIGVPYQYGTTDDGLELSAAVRGTIRLALLGGRATGSEVGSLDRTVPLAFGPSADRLRPWLLAPDADHPELTRVAVALWHRRPDLRAVFPDIDGADVDRYRTWLATDPGAAVALPGLEHEPPPDAPDVPAGARDRVRETLRRFAPVR
ncbi:MAG: hypothetical protein RIB65_04685 [Ilumatobacter fluminis]|uniref:hypothetical protein n=1 Tax=Ilumatobacter fluminis TaxID=467091 RepID=UPI0032EE9FE9